MSQLEQKTKQVPILLDDIVWDSSVALVDDIATCCYQCGVCSTICPWIQVKGQTKSVRWLMRQAQLGLRDGSEEIWTCSACALCELYCPRGVDITDSIRRLRFYAWEDRRIPAGLPSVLWSMYWNGNPWSQPPSSRSRWAQDLKLSPFDPKVHEILLYVGCTASFDPRAQKVAQAVVKLFNAAGVLFGYLGDDEPCCGEAALSVGHKPFFLEMAEKASNVFLEKKVSHLVTLSPHCYDVFKNHYPDLSSGSDGLILQHYSQFLAQLVREGRLNFDNKLSKRLTVHDPCLLARKNREIDSIRLILGKIPGVELVEMVHNGLETICCGGGGGRMFIEGDSAEHLATIRIKEALTTCADTMITACPFCITCLEDTLKGTRINKLMVLDVAELAIQAINN